MKKLFGRKVFAIASAGFLILAGLVLTVRFGYFSTAKSEEYSAKMRLPDEREKEEEESSAYDAEKVGEMPLYSEKVVGDPELSPLWNVRYHGTCCEGNMAASGNNMFVLLPELAAGNDILKSTNSGLNWTKKYPSVDVSAPYGIEGDLQAIGNDVIYFGTLLASGIAGRSTDQGETWTTVPIPVAFPANDQSWSYLGPFRTSACPTQSVPYVLAGWYRIGSVALFSCDGGLTWAFQTPLPADADPIHLACQINSHDPTNPGDTRVVNNNFVNMKSGRHGAWGTDTNFYWTDTDSGLLYVCKTGNFGATWTGVRHPIAAGPGADGFVTHAGFDRKGTLYVMHGDKIYVSFNQGESFAYTHTMPKYANQEGGSGEAGSDQFFVINDGTIHLAVVESFDGDDNIWCLKATGIDTANPVWSMELVDRTGDIRRDFVQIVIDGNGIPAISYITPTRQVTTATRKNSPPVAQLAGTPLTTSPSVSVQFDGNASSDVDSGPIASYTFDFGDGSPVVTQTTPIASHAYAAPGTFTARLTVKDSRGLVSTNTASVVVTVLGPTAASASVAGRVIDSGGRGVAKALMTITDENGASVSTTTNLFGYYKFENVRAGASYIVTVGSKRYGTASKVITVNEDVSEVDLVVERSAGNSGKTKSR